MNIKHSTFFADQSLFGQSRLAVIPLLTPELNLSTHYGQHWTISHTTS
jgi:hypothetical protein